MNLVPIEVRQDKVDILLTALKLAESYYTENGKWEAAKQAGKLNRSLRNQIFNFEPPKEYV